MLPWQRRAASETAAAMMTDISSYLRPVCLTTWPTSKLTCAKNTTTVTQRVLNSEQPMHCISGLENGSPMPTNVVVVVVVWVLVVIRTPRTTLVALGDPFAGPKI